ncbi:MAG TPA: protein tyrosine phosphatase family protein [Candidatus Polarisedimenticolaceae bacterium]|nr:protein tyrosine phosphatase family protein [Candidatus Polarisedimenticolaceae bacterium]
MRKTLLPALLLTALLPAGAQSLELPPGTPAIPNAAVPLQGLLSGGQPTPEHLAEAARAGYRTVINLRDPSEPGFAWEAEKVKALGMDYVSLPVAGAASLTRETVERFDAVLDAALAEGPVLVHCSSGNRNGALLALRGAWLGGLDAEAAIALGKAAGLTRLEPAVRALLTPPPK